MAGRKRKASTATPANANAKKVEPDTTPETSGSGRRRSLRVSSTKKSKYFEPESNSESEQAPEEGEVDEVEDEEIKDKDESVPEPEPEAKRPRRGRPAAPKATPSAKAIIPKSKTASQATPKATPKSASKTKAKPKSKGKTSKKDVYEDEPNNNPTGDDEEDSFDESAPPKVTFIPLPKLRGTGGVEYSDDTLHPNTLAFLADLKANNVRSWLKSNDNEFRRSLKDWESWVTTFTDKMMECDPTIPELPFRDVNFRIYRDIRFSNDPTPYKPHYSAAWSRTGRKGPYACYYVHVEPGGHSLVGGGLWHPDGPALQRIRADIDQRPNRLRDILFGDSELRKTFFPESVRGSKGCLNAGSEKKVLWDSFCGGMNAENVLKKAPKGYPANHPNVQLLKLRNFTLSKRVDDSMFTDTNGQERVKEIVRAMVPFITYLNRIVMPDPGDDDDDDEDEDDDGGGGGGGGEDDEEDDEDMDDADGGQDEDDDGKEEEGEEDVKEEEEEEEDDDGVDEKHENDNIEVAGDKREADADEHDYSVYSAADLMKQLGLSCWVEAIEPQPKAPKVTTGKKRRRKSYY